MRGAALCSFGGRLRCADGSCGEECVGVAAGDSEGYLSLWVPPGGGAAQLDQARNLVPPSAAVPSGNVEALAADRGVGPGPEQCGCHG